MDVFSTLEWPWLTHVFLFSNSLWISHNLISFILEEILYNGLDKAKPSSFLYQSEDNAAIVKDKEFSQQNIHCFSLFKTSLKKIFSKRIFRQQRQSFKIPKNKRFTIESCRCHQMKHHWLCPNVSEKIRKIYRVIRLRYFMESWWRKCCQKVINSCKLLFWVIQRLNVYSVTLVV